MELGAGANQLVELCQGIASRLRFQICISSGDRNRGPAAVSSYNRCRGRRIAVLLRKVHIKP